MLNPTWLQDHAETDSSLSSDIAEMITERGNTCISIIVPTHRFANERRGDRNEVMRAIFAAKEMVQFAGKGLLQRLDECLEDVDLDKNKEGLGLFVSPRIKKGVKFPFPVTKKIKVNKFFDLHDLLYLENYSLHYFLLDISKKEIHLFHGLMDNLEEIKNSDFPRIMEEEYEYSKPSHSSSDAGYTHEKGFEKDKSILGKIRMKKKFTETDKLLSKYLKNNLPILLCGAEENVSVFRSVSKFRNHMVGSISDNYRGTEIHDLSLLAWLKIRSFIDGQKIKLVNELKEKIGERLAVTGVEDVWEATKEGRGLKLLVEKNYSKAAFISPDNNLYSERGGKNFLRYTDAVNEIITTVLEKKGNVVIVEKDVLQDHERIALILRY